MQIAELSAIPLSHRGKAVAQMVHENQFDKAGERYITHPLRVELNLHSFPGFSELTAAEKQVASNAAWMHDVLEDSVEAGWPQLTGKDLSHWGFDKETVNVVELLSKNLAARVADGSDVDIDEYLTSLAGNKIARMVKICDTTDNCNHERVKRLSDLGASDKFITYIERLELIGLSKDDWAWVLSRIQVPASQQLSEAIPSIQQLEEQ